MLRRKFIVSALSVGLYLLATGAEALTNSQLARQSLLKISDSSKGSEAVLSAQDMRKLPMTVLRTTTPWTDGEIEFEGVYLKDIIERFAPDATMGKATALNDYQIKFELSDMVDKQGFVAFKRDGVVMSRRDKGPYWVVFPWSDRPELDARTVHGLSIWQLVDLDFH